MSALSELPRVALAADWAVDTLEPDHFGDVRSTAISDAGTVRLVFDNTGKLTGGYFDDRHGKHWHTTSVTVAKGWLER